MTRLNYQSPQRKPSASSSSENTFTSDPKEFIIPLALLMLGLVIYGVAAFVKAGAEAAMIVMGILFLFAVIQTVLGVGAAYLTAVMLKTSFGALSSAFVKFAGIIVFTGAIAFVIPMGGIISLAIYFGLLSWLFGLEMYESVIFAIVFWVVRLVTMIGAAAMILSAMR